jgi:hypothetical protein
MKNFKKQTKKEKQSLEMESERDADDEIVPTQPLYNDDVVEIDANETAASYVRVSNAGTNPMSDSIDYNYESSTSSYIVQKNSTSSSSMASSNSTRYDSKKGFFYIPPVANITFTYFKIGISFSKSSKRIL